MSEENQLLFNKRDNFKTLMAFEVMEWDDTHEFEQEVDCVEDIESFMKLYLEKNWEELFADTHVDHRKVCDVEFIRLHIVAKEEKGVLSYFMERSQRAVVSFDHDVLGDENASKIKQIRNVIGH